MTSSLLATVLAELVLSQSDVPPGFKLKESRDRSGQVARVFQKARFLSQGDGIWSEATLFDDESLAGEAWAQLVDFHKTQHAYDDVRRVRAKFGDEAYVHAGAMNGRPGLWAAVRVGVVVHRFNTFGLTESESLELLRRQLAKHRQSVIGRSPVGTANKMNPDQKQREAHAAYGNRIPELQRLLRRSGLHAPADALEESFWVKEFKAEGGCMERLVGGPHGEVWCVEAKGHGGDHAGRCIPCDMALQTLNELKSRTQTT